MRAVGSPRGRRNGGIGVGGMIAKYSPVPFLVLWWDLNPRALDAFRVTRTGFSSDTT